MEHRFDDIDLTDVHLTEMRTIGGSDERVMELHENECQDRAVLLLALSVFFFVWVAAAKLQYGV